MVQIIVDVDKELLEKLDSYARATDRDRSKALRYAIRRLLEMKNEQ